MQRCPILRSQLARFQDRVRPYLPPRVVVLLWGLACCIWWVRYHPFGLAGVVFDDDARQHIYWMARFLDPALFPDDPTTDFIASYIFAPLGYQWLYRCGTMFLEPLLLSQVVSLGLLLGALWLLDGLVRFYTDDRLNRCISGLLFLLYHTHNPIHNIMGGFARSFAMPLLLLFLLFLQRQALRTALLVVFIELVFYPPTLLNTLALAGDELLKRWWRRQRDRWLALDIVCLLAVTAAAAVVLVSVYSEEKAVSGANVTYAEARQMAEFYPGGRSVFFQDNWLVYILTGRSGIGLGHLAPFLGVIAIMGSVLGWKRLRIPSLVWGLTWTSLALFTLAHLVLFRLYLPSRYTFYTMSLAALLVIGVNVRPFWDICLDSCGTLGKRVRHASRRWRYLGAGSALAGYALLQSFVVYAIDPRLVVLDRQDMAMLDFLHTLPGTSLIAGHPFDMDNVPLFAQRKVLVSGEISHPYYLGHYRRIKDKLRDTLETYYSDAWEDVLSFVQQYHVDAFVIHLQRFHPHALQKQVFFEPFDSMLRPTLQQRSTFILQHAPQSLRCFENERYIVLCFTPVRNVQSLSPTQERTAK